MVQVMRRTATGMVAWEIDDGEQVPPTALSDGGGEERSTDLEHLDECNAEVEICEVAADEGQAEEEADRHDGPQVDLSRHLDILPAVEQGRRPREDLRHDGAEGEMPRREDDGIGEAGGVEDPLVEEDDARAHGYPCHHVDRRRYARLWRRLCLLHRRIGDGQQWRSIAGLGARDLAREALLLVHRRHGGGDLGAEEGLEGERPRPFERAHCNQTGRRGM
jgi:hypothetical protein